MSNPLSQELKELSETFKDHALTLGEVVHLSHGRIYDFLILLASLPFLTPIPLPFLSVPFGLLVIIMGLRMSLGQKPWLPDFILKTRFPSKFFPRLFNATSWLVEKIEYFMKPRIPWISENFIFIRIGGVMMAISGLLLALPIPPVIPFTNVLPAYVNIFISAGILLKDGLAVLIGYLLFIVTSVYFVLLVYGGKELFDYLFKLIANT